MLCSARFLSCTCKIDVQMMHDRWVVLRWSRMPAGGLAPRGWHPSNPSDRLPELLPPVDARRKHGRLSHAKRGEE